MTRPIRLITEDDLTKDEIHLLGMLLQGMAKRNLSAGVKLVKRGWLAWSEPDGQKLLFTPRGLLEARKLWPGLDENPPLEKNGLTILDRHVASGEGCQLALAVPPIISDPDALSRVLERVLGPHGTGLAQYVLESYPQGRGLATASVDALVSAGIPRDVAAQIHDAFELARACRHRNERWGKYIKTSEDMAASIFEPCGVADLEVEHFWVGAVDGSSSLIEVFEIAKGSLNQAVISMRDVFTPLLRARAAAFFIGHNHPSCDLLFSPQDLRFTQRVLDVAIRLEISLLDHVVLAPDGRFASLRDERGFA